MVIDNDLTTCQEIKASLENPATDVWCAHSAHEAVELLARHHFCLVIMEIFLSETDGIELVRMIRQIKPVPILVLSSDPGTTQKIEALHAGAHGYIEKPCDPEECLAQAQSLIELYTQLHPGESRCYTLAFGLDLIIDPTRYQATLKGEPLNLTRKEFELLFCLARNAGQVLSREQLYCNVWQEDTSYNVDELVKAHIKSLRKKLAQGGKEYIHNQWGVGYRFSVEEEGQP